MISFADIGTPPARYPKPLGGRLKNSDGPRLLALLDRILVGPDGKSLVLDQWQRALLCHLLERYPRDWGDPSLAGRLRWRRAIVTMGRQNGKSVIGSAIALYGLLQHSSQPSVIGVATSVDQANIIYGRVLRVVGACQPLRQVLSPSGTRGIRWRDGRGSYQVKPSKEEGLQGIPITVGVADELHIMRPGVWRALVNGQRSVVDSFLAGVTTAGDSTSELLLDLYAQGQAALEDEASRFGLFAWEAVNDDLTPDNICAANPAVACGRIPVERVISDAADQPQADRVRYTLNRFVAAAVEWFDDEAWGRLAHAAESLPDTDPVAIGVDRAPGWAWVSWVAVWRDGDKLSAVRLASRRGLTESEALDATDRLCAAFPSAAVAGSGRRLSTMLSALRNRGREVWAVSDTETAQALEDIMARLASETISHDGCDLYAAQFASARRKLLADKSWTLVPGEAGLDAAGALTSAVACCNKRQGTEPLQLF